MRAIELGRAARAAGEGQEPPAAAPGGDRRHRGRARARSSGSPSWSRGELNVKELEFVSEEGELVAYAVKPNYRTLGPRFGKRDAAGRGGGRGARPRPRRRGDPRRAADRDQHRRRRAHARARRPDPGDAAARGLRGRGARRAAPWRWRSSSTTSCAARASRARSSTRSRTPASRPASTSPTGSRSRSAATTALLDAARAHEEYIAGETLATSVAYDGDGVGEPRRRSRAASCGSESNGERLRPQLTLTFIFMSSWTVQMSL